MPDGQHTIIDVHVLLVRGDELLLTQRRGSYGGGMWHLPSGKLDAGESLPAGAAREAEEEVGVRHRPRRPAPCAHGARGRVGAGAPACVFFEARRWFGERPIASPTNARLSSGSGSIACPTT
jgi:8-oxo-dGTP pyrophosphatase MutT (NUDIX family)